MNTQTIEALDRVAPLAVDELERFFLDTKADPKRAQVSLGTLGRLNSGRTARLKEFTLRTQLVRVTGGSDDQLRQILAELTPPVASGESPKVSAVKKRKALEAPTHGKNGTARKTAA